MPVPHFVVPARLRAHAPTTLLSIALVAVLVYAFHERGVANRLDAQGHDAAQQLQDTHAQIGALTARLDAITADRPAMDRPSPSRPSPAAATGHSAQRRPAAKVPKPDPRWKQVENRLDAQGAAIDSTRQELAATRTDLQGSIARTHEELVVLQKKGERSYFEFDLDKSKNFHPAGPVGVSLRKANTKHQYADLELLVDDRQLSKKHLNLYEPVVFYPAEERQPVELVINSITKNHIHGYIGVAKYKPSELAATPVDPSATTVANSNGQPNSAEKPRQRLPVPR
jgi:hypothetical protein